MNHPDDHTPKTKVDLVELDEQIGTIRADLAEALERDAGEQEIQALVERAENLVRMRDEFAATVVEAPSSTSPSRDSTLRNLDVVADLVSSARYAPREEVSYADKTGLVILVVKGLLWALSAMVFVIVVFLSGAISFNVYKNGVETMATVGDHYRYIQIEEKFSHLHNVHFDGHTVKEVDLGRKMSPGTEVQILYVKGYPDTIVVGGKKGDTFLEIWEKGPVPFSAMLIFSFFGLFSAYKSLKYILPAIIVRNPG